MLDFGAFTLEGSRHLIRYNGVPVSRQPPFGQSVRNLCPKGTLDHSLSFKGLNARPRILENVGLQLPVKTLVEKRRFWSVSGQIWQSTHLSSSNQLPQRQSHKSHALLSKGTFPHTLWHYLKHRGEIRVASPHEHSV